MKTLKEVLSLLPIEGRKEILEGILGELQNILLGELPNISKEQKDKLIKLNELEKDELKKFFKNKLFLLEIDDEDLEKLKKVYHKAD
ncbi:MULTISPECIES: hypothetical protein [Bacteria]|uniref:hypothetical protein n=1 Tax=Bacteria TaxID=2 RepID=UPI003F4046C5